MEARIAEIMKELGSTTNGARAYLALLKNNPSTGYEVAAQSGVPRSAIYGVLKQLAKSGLIQVVAQGPTRYVPLPPAQLCELLETRFTKNLDELRDCLERVVGRSEDITTWTVQGYGEMLSQAAHLINSSTQTVVASLWRREALALQDELTAAQHRGVDIVLFSFTSLPEDLGRILSYGLSEKELEQSWSHRIILMIDQDQVLVGGAEDKSDTRAVVTKEPALVEMARANLVLDVTLYGERLNIETTDVVSRLRAHLAPIDELVGRTLDENGDFSMEDVV